MPQSRMAGPEASTASAASSSGACSASASGIKPMDIMRIARSAGGALLAQAALHGELARVEWEEEKNRLLKMLLVTLSGFACLLCLMLFGGGLLLALLWETDYRIHAVLVLLVLYATGLAIAWQRFKTLATDGEKTFAATREEMAADIALIRSKL